MATRLSRRPMLAGALTLGLPRPVLAADGVYASPDFFAGFRDALTGLLDLLHQADGVIANAEKAGKAVRDDPIWQEIDKFKAGKLDLDRTLTIFGITAHVADLVEGIDQDLARARAAPLNLLDSRAMDQLAAFGSWTAGQLKQGTIYGGIAALVPEWTRFAADLAVHAPIDDTARQGVKAALTTSAMAAGIALALALLGSTTMTAPAWALGAAAAGFAGGAYDAIVHGQDMTKGAGTALATIFGAISHRAEAIRLPLGTSIETFFANIPAILRRIPADTANAMNRRYAMADVTTVTIRTTEFYHESCTAGFCTRTYRQDPPKPDAWTIGGGGKRPPPAPPPAILGGVSVDPRPVSGPGNPDAIGAAALGARLRDGQNTRGGRWEVKP